MVMTLNTSISFIAGEVRQVSKLAELYQKKYELITYSGTLAFEIALRNLGLKPGEKIAVPSNACYSLLHVILKLNLMPVLIIPKNNLVLTVDDIKPVLLDNQIKIILLVHQYGITCNVNQIKNMLRPDIKIIEDTAQIVNYSLGKNSDYIISSFGITKPLSYGIGGIVLSDNDINQTIDFANNESRNKNSCLMAYAYPNTKPIDIQKLIRKAGKYHQEQNKVANLIEGFLIKQDTINYIQDNDATWHRYPIWIDDESIFKKILNILDKHNIGYQLEQLPLLEDLEIFSNCTKYGVRNKSNYIYLRTRNVNRSNIKKAFNRIIMLLNT